VSIVSVVTGVNVHYIQIVARTNPSSQTMTTRTNTGTQLAERPRNNRIKDMTDYIYASTLYRNIWQAVEALVLDWLTAHGRNSDAEVCEWLTAHTNSDLLSEFREDHSSCECEAIREHPSGLPVSLSDEAIVGALETLRNDNNRRMT